MDYLKILFFGIIQDLIKIRTWIWNFGEAKHWMVVGIWVRKSTNSLPSCLFLIWLFHVDFKLRASHYLWTWLACFSSMRFYTLSLFIVLLSSITSILPLWFVSGRTSNVSFFFQGVFIFHSVSFELFVTCISCTCIDEQIQVLQEFFQMMVGSCRNHVFRVAQ